MSVLVNTKARGTKNIAGTEQGVVQSFTQVMMCSFPTAVLAMEYPLYGNDKDHMRKM